MVRNIFYLYYNMLKIGFNENNNIQTKEILDEGYTDITSICAWCGLINKKIVTTTEGYNQIELFYKSLGENIDNDNKIWYEKYLYKKNKND